VRIATLSFNLTQRELLTTLKVQHHKKPDMGESTKVAGTIPVLYLKEAEVFIAYSPLLDLSSCGSTFEEADKNFDEAVNIFFSECDANGTLEEALTACGWGVRVVGQERVLSPPAVIGRKDKTLPVLF
jgi:hypothetical protein